MVISDMFKKVFVHLASNHRNVRKEILNSMYGTVLDCPTATAYKLGTARQLVRSVEKNMRKYHVTLEEACDGCGATVAEYEAAQTLLENNKDFKPED